jgi:hypothetical protein
VARSRIAVWFAAALVGLTAVACAGEDRGSDANEPDERDGDRAQAEPPEATAADYVDAIVAISSGDSASDEEQNRCLAKALVDAVGVEGFTRAGVAPEDIRSDPNASPVSLGITFSAAQKEALFQEADDCVDVADLLVGELVSGDVYTPEQLECFKDGLDESLVKGIFVAAMTEGDAYQPPAAVTQELAAVMGRCGMAG